MKRGPLIATICVGVVFVGVGLSAQNIWSLLRPAPREPLPVRLDDQGPYLILFTSRSAEVFAGAIDKAKQLHPDAQHLSFDPKSLAPVLDALKEHQPKYALVFVQPDELDVNFAWQWLTLTTQIDDDPFVDVRTGFITGADADAALSFVERIGAAAGGRLRVPAVLLDDLGPPEQGSQRYFNVFESAMMLPAEMGRRLTLRSIAHGKGDFTDARLSSLEGAGLIHFGGHGHPDRIDDGLTATQVRQAKLSPCVIFNGACYTGVVQRWFEPQNGRERSKDVRPAESFCLSVLRNDVLGYLAALHPDHGMPVYQEIEFLACNGGSLGSAMKHTHDGVILGAGGKLPALGALADRSPFEQAAPAEIMLRGTASRVLFGDPALVLCDGFVPQPFSLTTAERGNELRVTATVTNAELKSTFTDTYRNDLNPEAPFNDRALVAVELPAGWESVGDVEVKHVTARGAAVPHRLVGYALEQDRGRRLLHVQVDVPAKGFQQSALRDAGATVEFVVTRKAE